MWTYNKHHYIPNYQMGDHPPALIHPNEANKKRERCPKGTHRNRKGECVPSKPRNRNNPTQAACPEGQEMFHGNCVDKCGSLQKRDKDGNCVDKTGWRATAQRVKNLMCPEGEEKYKGKCVKKCPEHQKRFKDGSCVDRKHPKRVRNKTSRRGTPVVTPASSPRAVSGASPRTTPPKPNRARSRKVKLVCPENQVKYKGNCVDKCKENEKRNRAGDCVDKKWRKSRPQKIGSPKRMVVSEELEEDDVDDLMHSDDEEDDEDDDDDDEDLSFVVSEDDFGYLDDDHPQEEEDFEAVKDEYHKILERIGKGQLRGILGPGAAGIANGSPSAVDCQQCLKKHTIAEMEREIALRRSGKGRPASPKARPVSPKARSPPRVATGFLPNQPAFNGMPINMIAVRRKNPAAPAPGQTRARRRHARQRSRRRS